MNTPTNWTIHSVMVKFHATHDVEDKTVDTYWTVIEEVDGIVTTYVVMSHETIAKEYASQLGKVHRNQSLKLSA